MPAVAPLKILHVATHEAVYRGGAVQLCRMALGQRRRGHEVSVVVHQRLHASGKRIAGEQATWSLLTDAGIALRFMSYTTPWGIMRLRRHVAAGGYDILHAHRDGALFCSWIATRGMTRPALVAQRGTVSAPPWWVAPAFRSPRVRAVVAVAQAVKDALADSGGVDPEKIRVVYGSVDTERFAPRAPAQGLLDEHRIPAGVKVIGNISAFRKAKGYDVFCQALAKVFAARPDVYAVCLGKKVPRNVRPLAKAAGIRERCRLLKHQSDVASWLSIMDVTVVAATGREGLSGVLRESLAMGIPAISTDTAGNREIIRDGETGLLVPVGDADALAAALLRSLGDPAEAKTMADAGRLWVEENCSLDAQAERLEALYRSLLAQS